MALQTRREILETARRLFAERGYVATSVNDIAEEAGVAVQTIYARLGSKRGILVALLDVIDEEAGVPEAAAAIQTAATPAEALSAAISLTRAFVEKCGDVINALVAAAAVEPELGDALSEGERRHREGARFTIDRIAELGGLRDDVPRKEAAALFSAATAHYAWGELIYGQNLSFPKAERVLTEALTRAILGTA
jgi:AcrR family transcriptional regulator